MDSFEFNKIIGALLGTIFFVFSIVADFRGDFRGSGSRKPGLRDRSDR